MRTVVANFNSAEAKMDVTVDVGSNITSLVERLAQQIGVTADKVFPWYVQQAQLEGWTMIFYVASILVILTASFAYSFGKSSASINGPNAHFFVTVFSGVALFVALGAGGREISISVQKIVNPQYHAVKMLTQDIGRLTAR